MEQFRRLRKTTLVAKLCTALTNPCAANVTTMTSSKTCMRCQATKERTSRSYDKTHRLGYGATAESRLRVTIVFMNADETMSPSVGAVQDVRLTACVSVARNLVLWIGAITAGGLSVVIPKMAELMYPRGK